MFDWDWAAAENELLRAVELNPSNVNAHDVYGMFLAAVENDAAAALAAADRVLELDPLSPRGNSAACWTILLAGDYERATVQASLTLEMYPQALHALYVLGWAKLAQSKPDEAVPAFQKGMSVSPEDRMVAAMLGHAYARMGQHDAARKLLRDMDRAFASLENCCREHEPKLFSLRTKPIYEPLREDARFGHMLRRLGLVGEIWPT